MDNKLAKSHSVFYVVIFLTIVIYGSTATHAEDYSLSSYNYHKAVYKNIPVREASGVAVDYRNNYLFVHEDSNNPSILYVFDNNATKIKEIDLRKITNHDWEDITTDRQGTFWIIDSGGTVHSFKLDCKANLLKDSIQTWFLPEELRRKNIESIDFSPECSSFIIITKGHGNKVYLLNKDFSKLKYLTSIPEYLKMKPSGLTHHPITGHYFVLTFWGNKIVEFSQDFSIVLNVLPLKTKAFYGFQPEGIDFDADYNLIIVSEKPWYKFNGHSTIVTIPHNKFSPSHTP